MLWWQILEAGETCSVHTVGLDAPLLLLVNLGFCRTAVGDGALVHHCEGDSFLKAGWKTIGDATKTAKNRVRKTLHTMTESKDSRGNARLNMIHSGAVPTNNKNVQLGSAESDMIENSGSALRHDGFGAEGKYRGINVSVRNSS